MQTRQGNAKNDKNGKFTPTPSTPTPSRTSQIEGRVSNLQLQVKRTSGPTTSPTSAPTRAPTKVDFLFSALHLLRCPWKRAGVHLSCFNCSVPQPTVGIPPLGVERTYLIQTQCLQNGGFYEIVQAPQFLSLFMLPLQFREKIGASMNI